VIERDDLGTADQILSLGGLAVFVLFALYLVLTGKQLEARP